MEENQKFCLGLYSGSFDKLTMAGVMLSGAAADDMDVDIFVFIQGARVFRKGVKNVNTMEWIEFLEMAKELTNVKVHVCGLAGKMWGGEKKEDFIDLVDDIVGISQYITAAAEADLNILL